jgi:hypothetical protein
MYDHSKACSYFISEVEKSAEKCDMIDSKIDSKKAEILMQFLRNNLAYLSSLNEVEFMEEMAYSLVKFKVH